MSAIAVAALAVLATFAILPALAIFAALAVSSVAGMLLRVRLLRVGRLGLRVSLGLGPRRREALLGLDDVAVTAARERWKAYKEAGHKLVYYQQSPAGKWEEKARSERCGRRRVIFFRI